MSIQPFQIIQLLLWLLLFFLIYRFKNNKLRAFFIFAGLIVFLANPIRFKQENMSKIERRFTTEDELPEIINSDKKSFSEKQINEMEILKKQSTEIMKNEND